MAIFGGKAANTIKMSASADTVDSACSICLTEAENPVTKLCRHLYCLECLENLCLLGELGNKYTIECQGAAGSCNKILALAELEEQLLTSSLEHVFRVFFMFYKSKNPQLLPKFPYIFPSSGTRFGLIWQVIDANSPRRFWSRSQWIKFDKITDFITRSFPTARI